MFRKIIHIGVFVVLLLNMLTYLGWIDTTPTDLTDILLMLILVNLPETSIVVINKSSRGFDSEHVCV